MPRSIWKGSIAFGLVSIPVELHTAVRDHRPKFRMLHARDKSPVRYERICQREGKPVSHHAYALRRLRQSLAQNQGPAARDRSAKRARAGQGRGRGRKKTRHAA
jgi:hypothetical protein